MIYKKSLGQIIFSSITIAFAIVILQLSTSFFYTGLVAILFGTFSRSSDQRKCPLYAIGILAGSLLAGLIRWNLTIDKARLNHLGLGLQGYVGTILGIVLISLAVGYLVKVIWRKSHPMLVQKIN